MSLTSQIPAQDDPVASALLSFVRCLGARDGHEAYLSTPITTGRAFVAWRHLSGASIAPGHPHYESLHHENVVALNLQRVPPLLAAMRERYPGKLVIDPTSLEDIAGWEQPDYHRFWCALIERYVAVVMFADGWQFSTGCIHEFAAALRSGSQVHDESFTPLSKEDGLALVGAAIAEIEALGVDSEPLRTSLRAVEQA